VSEAAWWRHLRGDPSRFLLDDDQPGVVWSTLIEVLDRPDDSPAVTRARRQARADGHAAEIMAMQEEGGWWGSPSAYAARWGGTAWHLIAAASLGADPQDPRAGRGVEALKSVLVPAGGGFSPGRGRPPAACFTSELCCALVRFGFGHDARVREAIAWLAEREEERIGWSCPDLRHILDGGCVVAAVATLRLAALLGRHWPRMAEPLAQRASRWLLERRLFEDQPRPRGWLRFSHPKLARADLLDALYGLARCGVPADDTVLAGVRSLLQRQGEDGCWMQEQRAPHGEPEGSVSRWVTFKAMVVLASYAGGLGEGT